MLLSHDSPTLADKKGVFVTLFDSYGKISLELGILFKVTRNASLA